MKYCRYGFSVICSTSSRSENWNFFLDNQGSQRHAQWLCDITRITREQISVLPLQFIPGDGVSQTNPSVFRIHFHSQWLIEIRKECWSLSTGLYMLYSSPFCKKYRYNLQEKSSRHGNILAIILSESRWKSVKSNVCG